MDRCRNGYIAQMESEYFAEEYNLSDDKKEEIREDFFFQNFEELKEEICKVYAQNYFNDIEFETDIELDAEFESLGSQQTWLCRLDRFFVEVPTNKAHSLLKWIFNNKYQELEGIVKEVVFLGSQIKYKVYVQDNILNVSKTSDNYDRKIKKESTVKVGWDLKNQISIN